MKKKLTLLILLLPALLMAQTGISKNGTITFDFGKKKQQQADTVKQQQPPISSDDDGDAPPAKKQKAQKPAPTPVVKKEENQPEKVDYKNEGLFKALFNVGINACQIDGDGYAGYNYPGLEAGIGAMLRVHRFLSVSMEIDYSQQGAKQAFIFTDAPQTLQKYRVQWDYI
jgi:hypothetical protein